MARLLLAFVLGALIAGALVFVFREQSSGPASPPSGTGGEPPAAALQPLPPAELEGSPEAPLRLAEIEAENQQLEADVRDLKLRVAAAVVKPKDPEAFRFGIPEKAPTFDQADWPTLGSHMQKLSALMPGLMKTFTEGGDVTAAIGRITKHNMPLAAFAVGLSRELDEPMPNKAYTHPAVIANLIRAALRDAETPLTPSQESAIGALGKAYESEVARGLGTVTDKSPALARLVAEVEAKSRFLDSVRGVLSSAQESILFHAETEGRVGLDLLSPGLSYAQRAGAHGTDRETLVTALLETLFAAAGLDIEEQAPFQWIAEAWVDEIPGVLEAKTQRHPDVIFPHVDDLQRQAKAQIAAIEHLLASGDLDTEQAQQLRETVTIVQPIVLPGGASEDGN